MCIFAQAFFVHAEFLVQFEKKVIIYLVKKKKMTSQRTWLFEVVHCQVYIMQYAYM